jgi:hypothetical protein
VVVQTLAAAITVVRNRLTKDFALVTITIITKALISTDSMRQKSPPYLKRIAKRLKSIITVTIHTIAKKAKQYATVSWQLC